MTKKWIHPAVLAASFSALILTGACGTQHTSDDQQTSETQRGAQALPGAQDRAEWPSPQVESGLATGMRLPLQDYMLAYPDEVDIENAKDKTKTACMARKGFTFSPPPSGTTPALSYDSMNMERRYGVTDARTAQSYGYQAPGAVEEPADDTVAEENAEGRSDAWFDALDVCASEANKKIGILYETDIAADLAAESLENTASNLKVQAAISNWQGCMSREKYQTGPTPQHAGESFAQSSTGAQPSTEETQMAVADVGCKQSSNLVSVWHKTEIAYQTKQISDHKAELDAEEARNAELIANARAVLAQN
ncbi:hypothetical protein [Streptomyces sp. NPDC005907]|uniref:hypothetical protein n=1 Tax=Streptomyces sp. NPDC005907 TaxID=3154571 RepID=UPI003406814D